MSRAELLQRSVGNEEQAGSDAFRIEYPKDILDDIVFDDVVTFLGEYRLNLQKASYKLIFRDGKLRDPRRGEPMETQSQRAIEDKFWRGKSVIREKAEKEGFARIDSQLNIIKDVGTIIWASPPGSKEEGYGDYGFIFVGKVSKQNSREKEINMTAIRVENPTISQFNKAMHLITGEKTENKTPEEFLRNPKVLQENLDEGYVDAILGISFEYKLKKEERKKFMKIIQRMDPLIKDFINLVKTGSAGEKIKGLNALENYALRIKKDYENNEENIIYFKQKNDLKIKDIMGDFGHKPPVVGGSCGSSSSKDNLTSSNFLNRRSSLLNSLTEDQEWFTCPKCSYKADGPVGNQCPGCGLTKEEYAQESGVTCD
jgi:hypothetical protein